MRSLLSRIEVPQARDASDAVVWACGATSLIGSRAIGVSGSRAASDAGLLAARDVAVSAAHHQLVVVSGHAAGVDTRAHLGAIESGGKTIAVLPEGIDHFRLRPELRNDASEENFLAVSEYEPEERWTVGRAMRRNKLLIALVDALFVIEPREQGGTLAAGIEALRAKVPVFVVRLGDTVRSAGASRLERGGAVAIQSMRELHDHMQSIAVGERLTQLKLLA